MNACIAAPIRKQASVLFFRIFFFLDEKETKNQDKTKLLRTNPAHPRRFVGPARFGKFGGMQFSPLCGVGCLQLTLTIDEEVVPSVEK